MSPEARAAALVDALDLQGLRLHADEFSTWIATHERLSAADAAAWRELASEVHAVVLARQGGVPAHLVDHLALADTAALC
jgi:hypothetical protein